MTEAAIDFLVENMRQLLNCKSKLIHFDEAQIQSIFEDMQFFRKFLEDTEDDKEDEKLKDLMTEIRELTCKVEDAIDLVLLKAWTREDRSETDESPFQLVLPKIIETIVDRYGLFGGLSKQIDSLKPEVMNIHQMISSLSPCVAERIRGGFDRATAEIESIKTRAQIYEEGLGFIGTGCHTVGDLLGLSQNMLELAEKIFHGFFCFVEVIHQSNSIENELLIKSAESAEEIKSAMKTIDFSHPYPAGMIHEFDLLLILLNNVPYSVWKTRLGIRGFFSEEFRSARREMMIRYKEGLSRTWVESRMVERVGDAIGDAMRGIKCMKIDIESYEKEIQEMGSSLSLSNEFYEKIHGAIDEMESNKTEMGIPEMGSTSPALVNSPNHDDFLSNCSSKIVYRIGRLCYYIGCEIYDYIKSNLAERMSYDKGLHLVHSLIAYEFLLLANLSESTEKICNRLGSLMDEIRWIKKEAWIYEENWSLIWPESYTAYDLLKMVCLAEKIHRHFNSFLQEIKSIKSKMVIREKRLDKWFGSFVADKFRLLFRLYQIVDLADKIRRSFESFREETNSIMAGLTFKNRRLDSRIAEKTCCGFGGVMEEIKLIKAKVMKIHENMKIPGVRVQSIGASSGRASSVATGPTVEKELVVGFVDEKTTIVDMLTVEHEKQLKLIQMVGMPGLGKTTLARKIYNDSFIQYHFYVRAWTYVSQAFRKKSVLLGILSSDFEFRYYISEMNDNKLGEELYKLLKGKRYLIVLDDIWDVGAWNELKTYFPNDSNGSRVMFTCRHAVIDMAKPHHLRFLNEEESWTLLQQKIFGKERCPPELIEIGKQIARKCGGLPLAIVVLSGLIAKNEKTQHWWKHVSQSVSSYIASDQDRYMDTLALSYNNLPHHLKVCFMYFGAFLEDFEIPVWKLIWLWVAEGFIQENQKRRLEEVAEDYLMDLIDRNLVLVSKKRSNGGIKACRVHDLLREFCMKKAMEENFLGHLCRYEHSFSSSCPMKNKKRRICIQSKIYSPSCWLSCGSWVRSFLSFGHSFDNLSSTDVSFICHGFQLLRVLDLSSIKIIKFPDEILNLHHLRYLALHVGNLEYFKPTIANLQSLQTLVIDGGAITLLVLDDFWKMRNLKHLYAKQLIEIPRVPEDGCLFPLNKLETIGKLDLRGLDEQLLQKIPHLQKLKCFFMESWGESHIFPRLSFLLHLETLNVIYDGFKRFPGKFPHIAEFPPNLKSLTLSNFRLPWDEMSTLGKLSNLEILKLSYKAFEGPRWEMHDLEFAKLKYLKLRGLDIKQWNASSSHFPQLQTLVLDDCKQFEEIPFDIGGIFTLELIQCWNCSASALKSAKQIEKQQLSLGNDGLRIDIHPYHYVVDESDHEDEDDAH